MRSPPVHRLSRRALLIGGSAAAGAVLLGACGDDTSETTGTSTDGTTDSDGGPLPGLALAQFFGGPMFVAGEESRLPFGVADQDGLLPVDETPAALTVQVLDPTGDAVGDAIDVERHADGLPRAYFPLRVGVEAPGIYTARTEIDGVPTEMSFQVHAASDVKVIRPGTPLPALDTPTITDAHGVEPICTNDPVCPLHEVTLAQALADRSPVALLVATPAFCQLAICGPVLDVLLEVRAGYPGVRFLHAEVYADPATDLDTFAPVVEPLGLHFEPCLVLARADGVVTERIDTIYDRTELQSRLDHLA
ncbi:MAG: hypothetical protein ABWZ76_08585 [Acidimicrobiales bacterium]